MQRTSLAEVGMSRHARTRMQQRAIPQEQVVATVLHGREFQRGDTIIYVVGRREIEAARVRGRRIDQLEGVHVVCSTRGTVITVFRDRQLRGIHQLRKAMR